MDSSLCKNSFLLCVFYLLVIVSTLMTIQLWCRSVNIVQSNLNPQSHKNREVISNYQYSGKVSEMRYVLIWTSIDENNILLGPLKRWKLCAYDNCYITDNKVYFKNVTDFDAVVFGPEVAKLTKDDFPELRSPYQKYIFVGTESAHASPMLFEIFDDFFNWTWTYRLESDIRHGFIILNKSQHIVGPSNEMQWLPQKTSLANQNLKDIISKKTKAAAWIATKCNSINHREKVALELKEELSKYQLTLDIYGKCGDLNCGTEYTCNKMMERDYYFYLAFEDAMCEDYVGDELLRAMQNNLVPIVYGGSNYSRFLPDNSYLDANNLTIENLAYIMYEMIKNNSTYEESFWWKHHYSYHASSDRKDTDEFCRLCEMLNNDKFNQSSSYTNFRKWWNPADFVKVDWL